jgi:hypothetical protein
VIVRIWFDYSSLSQFRSAGVVSREFSEELRADFAHSVMEVEEDRSYTCLPGGFKMPQVTVYKPNGETLLSTNAKKFEQTKGGIILHLEGEHARVYGTTMITTLPYVILCGQGC